MRARIMKISAMMKYPNPLSTGFEPSQSTSRLDTAAIVPPIPWNKSQIDVYAFRMVFTALKSKGIFNIDI